MPIRAIQIHKHAWKQPDSTNYTQVESAAIAIDTHGHITQQEIKTSETTTTTTTSTTRAHSHTTNSTHAHIPKSPPHVRTITFPHKQAATAAAVTGSGRTHPELQAQLLHDLCDGVHVVTPDGTVVGGFCGQPEHQRLAGLHGHETQLHGAGERHARLDRLLKHEVLKRERVEGGEARTNRELSMGIQ